MGYSQIAVTQTLDFAPDLSKEFVEIHATIECGFTLKLVRDTITRYSQMSVQISNSIAAQSFGQFFDKCLTFRLEK